MYILENVDDCVVCTHGELLTVAVIRFLTDLHYLIILFVL